MTDLAGRGPLGPKPQKSGPKPRRAIPKQSVKRKTYLASQARVDGLAHMGLVAQLPCLVCGAYGVEVHHEGKPRSDFAVLPLCHAHHRREFGPGAFHYSPSAFYAIHGSSEELLARVAKMLE